MGVRKTESRLPADLIPSDLGEAITSPDGLCTLVSYITSPLVAGRENTYVVFVTDAILATAVEKFKWIFKEDEGEADEPITNYGEVCYTPKSLGTLNITVQLLSSDNREQISLTLSQVVVPLNPNLEELILKATNEPGPGFGNPEVVRELVNDYCFYYQNVTLKNHDNLDGFQRFVYNMVYNGVLKRTPTQRKQHLERLAISLNINDGNFETISAEGAGICNIRLVLLAMISPAAFEWTELPEPFPQRFISEVQLRKKLIDIEERKLIDFFNRVRFPKSNIESCGRILEYLRDHYFKGANFNDILMGMSGTRAFWIIRHYYEGPIDRN